MEGSRRSSTFPANPGEGCEKETLSAEAQLEPFRDRLRLFAARRIGNWTEAEDVVQETLRRVLEAMQARRIEDLEALPAFVFRTALHVCQGRGRSAGREGKALRRVAASTVESADEDPLRSLIREEEVSAVRDALERLDSADRELLALTYGEALRTLEIGRRLNLTEGNVRVRRHRALQRLAELLGVTKNPRRRP